MAIPIHNRHPELVSGSIRTVDRSHHFLRQLAARSLSPGDDRGEASFLRPIGPEFLPIFHELLTKWDAGQRAPELIRMRYRGGRYSARVLPLRGVEGLDWYLCLAVPDRDYLEVI